MAIRYRKNIYPNRRQFLSTVSAAGFAAGFEIPTSQQNTGDPLLFIDDAADLSLLQQIIRIRSYSGGGEEGKLAEFLAEQMKALGLETQLMEVEPGRYNAIGFLQGRGGSGGQSLMLNGHIDTNPIGIGWTVDPLAATTRDGFVFGIGASNMKATCASFYGAARALTRAKRRLNGDLLITYVVGELQQGIGTLKLIDEGVVADTFIVGEPTDLAVLTLHAATLTVEIDTFGVTRHLSKMEESVSAIDLMVKVIARIKDMKFSGPNNPEYASVRRVNIGSMKAGLGHEYHDWRPGQVPDVATIKMSVRFGPEQSEETVLADLRQELEKLKHEEPRLQAEVRSIKPSGLVRRGLSPRAFQANKDAPIVKSVVANHTKIRKFAPEVGAVPPMRYYGSDASHLQHLAGMTGIVCGVGGKYNTMPDERIETPMFYDSTRIWTLTALDICK